MSRLIVPLLAAALVATAMAAFASAGGDGRQSDSRAGSYSIGLWGDVPYSDVQTTTGVPNLIADANRQRLAFTVHDGDIKSGSSRCDDAVYQQFKAFLNSFRAPALYTPGDNEWTDCDRPAAGGYDSAERLEYIRANFFDSPRSLGQRRLRVDQQEAPYVENLRWRKGGVQYATLHVVGSDNNLGDVAPDPDEWAARDGLTGGGSAAGDPGQPRLRPQRPDPRSPARSAHPARLAQRSARRLHQVPQRAAGGDDRLPPAGGAGAR